MKGIILVLLGLFATVFAQSEINSAGATLSNGTLFIECSLSAGLNNALIGTGTVKFGVLQPQGKVMQESDSSLIIYNFVTANNDGKNDYFIIEGLDSLNSYELNICNRLGHSVLKTHHYKNDWNGDDLEVGTYFYILKYKDKQLKNAIYLSR